MTIIRFAMAVCLLAGGFAMPSNARAQQLSASEVQSLLPGKRFNMRMMHPMDLVFHKNGTFRVGHHEPCQGGEKSEYKISRSGQVTLVFRNCDGRKRSTIYMEVHKRMGGYWVRDSNTRSFYRFVRR